MSKTLSEAEWLSASEPESLLEYLRAAGAVSERRFRLWCCSCVRRNWVMIEDERSRDAINAMELYVDGLITTEEIAIAAEKAFQAYLQTLGDGPAASAVSAAFAAFDAADTEPEADGGWQVPHSLSGAVARQVGHLSDSARLKARDAERLAQVDLLRHIFGNPYRPLSFPTAAPPTILGLAEAQYRGDNVAFALSDALCERGFGEYAEHFRQRDHPKGCAWLDAILGKS